MEQGGNGPAEGRIVLPGNTARRSSESNLDVMERLGENSHRSVPSGEGRESLGRGSSEGRVDRSVPDRGDDRVDSDRIERGHRSGNDGGRPENRGGAESREGRRDVREGSRGSGNGSNGNNGGGGGNQGNGGRNGQSSPGGNKGNRNKKGKNFTIKHSLITWVPWLFLVVLLFAGVWNSFKVPFVYDRSMTESLNLYLFQVDEASKFNHGNGYSGYDGMETQTIAADMVYEMGLPRYYVFVYNANDGRNWDFVDSLMEYDVLEDVPVFRVTADELEEANYYELSAGSPQVLEMTRINKETRAEVTNSFYYVDDWKKEWVDRRGEKKWYEFFKK